LDYNYNDNNVYMHKCHGGKNQKWHFAADGTPRLQSRYGGKCLDYNYNNKNVYMHNCHDGKNQKWYFQGASSPLPLKSNHDGLCFDYNVGNGNVYMHGCHDGNNQQWFLNAKSQIQSKQNDKCLDYNYNNKNVYMHGCHGGKNQQWYFDGKRLSTRYDNNCLDYNTGNKNVYMHGCHDGKNQQWYFSSNGPSLIQEDAPDEALLQETSDSLAFLNRSYEDKSACMESCKAFQSSFSGCVATILFDHGKLSPDLTHKNKGPAICAEKDSVCKPDLAIRHQRCVKHRTAKVLDNTVAPEEVATACKLIAEQMEACQDCPQLTDDYGSHYAAFTGGCMDQMHAYRQATAEQAGLAKMPSETGACKID